MSDLHLSHKPPVWRSSEKDWYGAMLRPIHEIQEVTASLIDVADLPWLISGDIFHKWNSPPSLINFAIDHLQCKSIAIPGQHDLPNHMDEQFENSPYATLVKANTIRNIDDTEYEPFGENGPVIRGYGWNTQLVDDDTNECISMIHRYVWMDSCSYQGAPNTNKVGEIANQLGKPKLIISGDNHIGFWHNPTRTFNCGSLMRLNRDQQHYKPRVGIVYSDCSVIPYYLDTDHDSTIGHFSDREIMDVAEQQEDVDEFLQELAQMGRGGLDFLDAVRRYANKHNVRKATAKLIEQILTGDK